MPKYYCEYCGIYLTHSSPSGRKQHAGGRKHIKHRIDYYSELLLESTQNQKMNPMMKFPYGSGLPMLPFNIPQTINSGPMQGNEQRASGNEYAQFSTLNIPGIMPTNITQLPISNYGLNNSSQLSGPHPPNISGILLPQVAQQIQKNQEHLTNQTNNNK